MFRAEYLGLQQFEPVAQRHRDCLHAFLIAFANIRSGEP